MTRASGQQSVPLRSPTLTKRGLGWGTLAVLGWATRLHPRVQRRLLRDLAMLSRELEVQIVLTTHSPYVLDELPPAARIYIMDGAAGKQIIKGVSPEFAMSKMDEDPHPEADIYVEDGRSGDLLKEIIISQDKEVVSRLQFVPFGAASVGRALGEMLGRFPRPSLVYLDGDQEVSKGCRLIPGKDAPEVVVFEGLAGTNWSGLAERISRNPADVIDAFNAAMTLANHHDWISYAGGKLVVGGACCGKQCVPNGASNASRKKTLR